MHRSYASMWLLLAPAGGLLLALSGCGGMDFAGNINIPEEQRHVLAVASADDTEIHLPGDHVFNIHLKSGARNPGPSGTASEESQATSAGDALCAVSAANGGIASAEFRLGHRLEHETGSSLTANIQVELDLARELQASPIPRSHTLAEASLSLVVVDSRRRTLSNLVIDQLTSDGARGSSSTVQRHSLQVVFEPQQSYSIMLVGKVTASADDEQEASARLEVKKLKMHVALSPAPTTTQTADQ